MHGIESGLEHNDSDSNHAEINVLGSIVRIVPLTDINGTDILPKYRFLKQTDLQPNRRLPGKDATFYR